MLQQMLCLAIVKESTCDKDVSWLIVASLRCIEQVSHAGAFAGAQGCHFVVCVAVLAGACVVVPCMH
jgi:hypothetical protein